MHTWPRSTKSTHVHEGLRPMPKRIYGYPPTDRAMYEPCLIELIYMASLALDDLFVDRLTKALTPLGDGGVETLDDGKGTLRIKKRGKPLIDITRAPVKSHARMRNKLESAEDHRDKPPPRPKANVDTTRAGVVVHDAAMIAAVYAAIGLHVGRFIRVKNAFAAGAEVNYGYRAILCNLCLESGLTVRQVFGGVHRAKWMALGRARRAIDGMAPENVQWVLEALLADSGDWSDKHNASLPSMPLNLAAEVQLIYQPYLDEGRKRSHLPYKVVRCGGASELARDAGGKQQSAEVRGAVKRAERACMDIVMAELA